MCHPVVIKLPKLRSLQSFPCFLFILLCLLFNFVVLVVLQSFYWHFQINWKITHIEENWRKLMNEMIKNDNFNITMMSGDIMCSHGRSPWQLLANSTLVHAKTKKFLLLTEFIEEAAIMRLILSSLTKPRTSLIHNVCEGVLEISSWAVLRTCRDGYQKLVASRQESASLDGMAAIYGNHCIAFDQSVQGSRDIVLKIPSQ